MTSPKYLLTIFLLATAALQAQQDSAIYTKPIFNEDNKVLREQYEAREAVRDSITGAIISSRSKAETEARRNRPWLLQDLADLERPAGPTDFEQVWHRPPVAQYSTGTCWSFCSTSFLEAEVHRQVGLDIKLAEMHTVYWEYVEKARRFVQERGHSNFDEGSEPGNALRIIAKYGAVPASDYTGLVDWDKHQHAGLVAELEAYLESLHGTGYWDEATALHMVRGILDKHLGPPPESIRYGRKNYTPIDFARKVLRFDADDYVHLISTISKPFWRRGEWVVPDNWWHDSSYVNVPLADWYELIGNALAGGYSMTISGDVSEPGIQGVLDVAVVPDFDIPRSHINQAARELRYVNRSTKDDHCIHLVGRTTLSDDDWYLIKDSGAGARAGEHWGYIFYREDYVRLKMMAFTLHKDAVGDLLKRIRK